MTQTETVQHVTTISGFRYQGEGTYRVTCSCGAEYPGIAYHRDAKRLADAHVAQAKAGVR